MPSVFAKKVIQMLSPSIGEFMATRKVGAACQMAGIDIEKARPPQKSLISQKLEVVCEPLGSNVAASIKKSVVEMHV